MTESEYIVSANTKRERLIRINQIIEALELQQISAVANSDVDSYALNDGQIQISTKYRSPEQIAKAIEAYDKIKARLESDLEGRIVRLADAESIRSNGVTY